MNVVKLSRIRKEWRKKKNKLAVKKSFSGSTVPRVLRVFGEKDEGQRGGQATARNVGMGLLGLPLIKHLATRWVQLPLEE
jgi:hypothetical protein